MRGGWSIVEAVRLRSLIRRISRQLRGTRLSTGRSYHKFWPLKNMTDCTPEFSLSPKCCSAKQAEGVHGKYIWMVPHRSPDLDIIRSKRFPCGEALGVEDRGGGDMANDDLIVTQNLHLRIPETVAARGLTDALSGCGGSFFLISLLEKI